MRYSFEPEKFIVTVHYRLRRENLLSDPDRGIGPDYSQNYLFVYFPLFVPGEPRLCLEPKELAFIEKVDNIVFKQLSHAFFPFRNQIFADNVRMWSGGPERMRFGPERFVDETLMHYFLPEEVRTDRVCIQPGFLTRNELNELIRNPCSEPGAERDLLPEHMILE